MSRWPRLPLQQRRLPASRWWLWLCVLHGFSSMLVWWAGDASSQLLTWRSGESWSRPWTWWTSAWVHLHTPHLIGNQMVIGAFAAWAWLVRPDRPAAVAWFLSWPIATVALNLWPQIGYCVGASGVLHAGVAIMAVFMILGHFQRGSEQAWGWILLIGLGFKVWSEQAWHTPVVWDSGANLSIVSAVHLTGALSGMALALVVITVYALIVGFLHRLRRSARLGDL
ncbi:MAG: hypothetical protein RLZZ612_893 [Pseudomonadota bacterium]